MEEISLGLIQPPRGWRGGSGVSVRISVISLPCVHFEIRVLVGRRTTSYNSKNPIEGNMKCRGKVLKEGKSVPFFIALMKVENEDHYIAVFEDNEGKSTAHFVPCSLYPM